MHVALLSPAWPFGTRPNGIVTYVHHMSTELVARGHRVTVLSGDVADGVQDVSVVRVEGDSRVSRLIRRSLGRHATVYDAWKNIARTLDRVDAANRVDVVEMEETFGLVGGVARNVRPAVVAKLHGPGFLHLMEEEINTAAGQRRIAEEGRALSKLSVLTAPSRWTLHQTLERYALRPEIAEAIGNPIESPPDLQLWNAVDHDRDHVLFVGRFDKVKGADLVVRAIAALYARRPRIRLTFVGPEPGLLQADGSRIGLAEFIGSLATPGLEARIDYVGPLPPARIQALRPRAAVTVVGSRQESQGYTAMEAMLQACPLVCTDSSGLSELVQHEVTGLKARPEDAADLAKQIERLLDSPELGRALGSAAREQMLTRHSPAVIVRQTLDVYERAIELKKG